MQALLGQTKQDPSIAKAQADQAKRLADQEAAQAADKKDLQVKQNAALNSSRKRRAGYRSLLSGMETGVPGDAGLRQQLG